MLLVWILEHTVGRLSPFVSPHRFRRLRITRAPLACISTSAFAQLEPGGIIGHAIIGVGGGERFPRMGSLNRRMRVYLRLSRAKSCILSAHSSASHCARLSDSSNSIPTQNPVRRPTGTCGTRLGGRIAHVTAPCVRTAPIMTVQTRRSSIVCDHVSIRSDPVHAIIIDDAAYRSGVNRYAICAHIALCKWCVTNRTEMLPDICMVPMLVVSTVGTDDSSGARWRIAQLAAINTAVPSLIN